MALKSSCKEVTTSSLSATRIVAAPRPVRHLQRVDAAPIFKGRTFVFNVSTQCVCQAHSVRRLVVIFLQHLLETGWDPFSTVCALTQGSHFQTVCLGTNAPCYRRSIGSVARSGRAFVSSVAAMASAGAGGSHAPSQLLHLMQLGAVTQS